MDITLGAIVGCVCGAIFYCLGCVAYTIYKKKHQKKEDVRNDNHK